MALVRTTRSVARFRCLAEACEDDCCHGWSVPIERLTHDRLKAAMARTPAESAEFRAAVQRGRRPRSDDAYASMRLHGERETCPFLSEARLCTVHGRFGAQALPQICANYPRVAARSSDDVEVFGFLSCPEMARLSLLHEDGMELIEAQELPARIDGSALVTAASGPYERPQAAVRTAVLAVLSLRAYPIATRLFMLATLGKNTADYFHRAITTLDDAQLANELAALSDAETVRAWHGEIARLQPASLAVAAVVSDLLRRRLESPSGGFRQLVIAALASYGANDGVSRDEAGQITMDLSRLWPAYQQRRDGWHAVAAARIDLYFENFAKAYWLREGYPRSPDLTTHTLNLLVRISVVRFLLFSHPDLLAAHELEPPARQAALDRVAVEVFYKFSRAVEHERTFLAEIGATLSALGDKAFTYNLSLALG